MADDIAEKVGKEFMKGVRQAGKEATKGGNGAVPGMGAVSPLPQQSLNILDQIAAEATSCRVSIQRMDPMTGAWEFIPSPGPINPKMLVNPGIENLVMEYAGGGSYQVNIKTPGYPDIDKQFRISGRPKDPGETRQQASFGGGFGGGFGGPSPAFGGGWGMNPWAPPAPQHDKSADTLGKLVETMMTMSLLERQGGGKRHEDDEVKLLREQMQRDREEFRKQQEASERKLEDLQRRKEMEAMQAASDKRFQEMVAMIKDGQKPQPTIADQLAPILPLLMPKNDGMADVWKAMAESQSSNSRTVIEMMKAQNERPGWDERLANVMGSMASMSTQMLQMQMQAQGGGSPWVDLLSQTIGEISDVFKTMFASGALGGDEEPQMQQAGPAQIAGQPTQQIGWGGTEQVQQLEQPQYAQHESITPPPPAQQTQPHLAAVPDDPAQDDTYNLDADPAFKTILDKIQEGGPLSEIAVRIHKHGRGQSGHPIAKAWNDNPDEVGNEILHQLGIPAERRKAVANEIVKYNKYLSDGGDPETYSRYIPARKPRRRVPTIEGPGGELGLQRFESEVIETPKEPPRVEPTEPVIIDVEPEKETPADTAAATQQGPSNDVAQGQG